MADSRSDTLKPDFYRSAYPSLLRFLMILSLSALLLLLSVIYYVFFPVVPAYFMVQPNNQMTQTPAMDYPFVARTEITRWASQAVISIYQFDFSNWEVRLKEVASFFTRNGFERFQDALKLNGLLSGVIERKLQVTAVVFEPPVIVAEGMLAGRYTWKVNVPVLLTYTSSSAIEQRKIYVTMVIVRVPSVESPRGYAIEQFYEESA